MGSPLQVARYLAEIARDRGIWGAVSFIKDAVVVPNHFHVLHARLSAGMTVDPGLHSDGITFRRVTVDELAPLRDATGGLPYDFFVDVSHGLRDAVVALDGTRLVGICWIVRPGEYSRFLRLASGQIELNYVRVLETHNGRNLSRRMMQAVLPELGEEGFRDAFIVVHVNNVPQLRAVQAAGFRTYRYVRHWAFHRPMVDG